MRATTTTAAAAALLLAALLVTHLPAATEAKKSMKTAGKAKGAREPPNMGGGEPSQTVGPRAGTVDTTYTRHTLASSSSSSLA